MTEQLILITTISALISLIIGALLATFFLPKLLKGIFKDTAREELDDLTQEVKDSQKENEVSISRSMKELEKTILDAKTVWKTNTGDIVQEFRLLNRGFLAWEEALSNPGEQGALAEEGLEVMLEAAGLIKGVSFETQITEHTDDGGIVRPDFYVYTPEEGVIIIDSKAPMTHYKNAIQADNETEKKEALSNHANSMYTYAQQLGQRDYTQATSRNTPDMVIMYVPNLAVYLAAIEARPTLIEEAWSHKVQICPPEAIYPVLKSIMLSWQQKKLYENVEEMHKQTIVIHDRLKKFHTHFSGIGKALTNASKTFNNSVRSWESRLKPAIRKLEEMGIADPSREIGSTESIEEQTRDISDK
tara:strand:- start:121 stop:1197 length:1077 start_codon:yes stop_codon:yes gene_type:complete